MKVYCDPMNIFAKSKRLVNYSERFSRHLDSLSRASRTGLENRRLSNTPELSRYAPTRLAGSPIARDLENKRITRVMSLQRVGKVDGSSPSDTDGHDPSLRIPTRLAGSPMARDLENKRIYRIMSAEGRKSRRIESVGHGWTRSVFANNDPTSQKSDGDRLRKQTNY